MTKTELQQLANLLEKYNNERLAGLRSYYRDPTINKNTDDLCDMDEMLCHSFELVEEVKSAI